MGLLTEDVLAGVDGGLEVHWVEVRRSGDQHHVDRIDHLLVGVEADEDVIIIHRDLLGLAGLEPLAGPRGAVLEDVGHGDERHVWAGIHGVVGGPAAASAAADQADPDLVAAGRVDRAAEPKCGQSGAGGGGLEEIPAGSAMGLAGGHGLSLQISRRAGLNAPAMIIGRRARIQTRRGPDSTPLRQNRARWSRNDGGRWGFKPPSPAWRA